MEKLFLELLEKAKSNKKAFELLKNTAVKSQHFELAVKLREIERDLFPESEEIREAKQRANGLNTLFRMVDLNVTPNTCYLIDEILKQRNEKGNKVTLMDASDIVERTKRIFEKE